MQRRMMVGPLCVLVTALSGCKKEEPAPAPQAAAPAAEPAAAAAPAPGRAKRDAKKYFQQKCVVCHGADGAGDGPGAAALDPKPRSFGDAEWQASIADDHIETVIVKGGAAAGKSAAMAPNPDLESKPEVVKELVAIVRGFAEE